MSNFSQNKKIAISTIALFIVSFSTMLFFLNGKGLNPEHVETSVLESDSEKNAQNEGLENSITFITDVEGVFKELSPGFCELINKNCEKLVGKKLFDYVNKEDLADLASIYGKLAQNSEKMDGIGPVRVLADKKEKVLILSAQPIPNKDGKVESIKFAVKDITEKIEGLNKAVDEEKDDEDSGYEKGLDEWLKRLYPKIKEIDEQGKLLVKIGYKGAGE